MWVGKHALIVLIILGGITGVMSYILFFSVAPVPGVMVSIYRINLTPQDIAAANPQAGGSGSNRC